LPTEQSWTAKRSGYIDQWRGISVLLVIFSHLIIYKFGPYLQAIHSDGSVPSKILYRSVSMLEMWASNAGMVGVCIFFVISGYLITQLMAREEIHTGTISLKAFYIRRACRILPALLSFIVAVSLLAVLGLTPMNEPRDTEAALSFLCNTSAVECPHQFLHLWSLAVEEQFYLFWPLLMIVAGRFRKHLALAAMITAACAALTPALLVREWLNNGLYIYCLSSGALFALSVQFRRVFEAVTKVPTWVLAVMLAVLLAYVITRWQALRPLGLLAMPPLIVLTVLARSGSVVANSRISRFLEQIGLVSYSLYLWHAIGSWKANLYSSRIFYWGSFAAFPFAWISYCYIEKPFIALGHRWSSAVKSLRVGKAARGEVDG
jgi:peptidoglycan/LPS O-acetylase OafA/YrhL